MENFDIDKFRLKKFFIENNYIPSSWRDATNFFNSYYGLNTLSSFSKKIVVKDEIVEVKVDSSYPFGAFIPEVWGTLNETEKVNAINMVKNYFVNMDLLNKQRIDISFIPPAINDNSEAGFAIGLKKNNALLYVNEKYILASADNEGMHLLGILIHELTHASQRMTQLNLNENTLESFDDFAKITSNTCDLSKSIDELSFKEIVNNGVIKFSESEINTIIEMFTDANFVAIAKRLLYSTLPFEIAAEKRATRIYCQIAKDMYKKYGTMTRVMYKQYYKQFGEYLTQKQGYKIEEDDYEQLSKISVLMCSNETRPFAIKHLMDLYLNKSLTKKVDDKIVKRAIDNMSSEYVETHQNI